MAAPARVQSGLSPLRSWQLSVTESRCAPARNVRDSIMPSVQRLPAFEPRRSIEEFVQLRREMLRFARALPPGAERNERRQIALSLRGLFRNKNWLEAHTWEGAALFTDHPSPSPAKEGGRP